MRSIYTYITMARNEENEQLIEVDDTRSLCKHTVRIELKIEREEELQLLGRNKCITLARGSDRTVEAVDLSEPQKGVFPSSETLSARDSLHRCTPHSILDKSLSFYV